MSQQPPISAKLSAKLVPCTLQQQKVDRLLLVCRYSSAVACVGRTYCACAAYNYVVLYDSSGTAVTAVLRAHSNKVTVVAAAEVVDHEVVLSGGRDKLALAWSVERHAVVRKQKLPGEPTGIIACPHDHNKAIVSLSTGSCVVWDWSRGACCVLCTLLWSTAHKSSINRSHAARVRLACMH